MKFLKALTHKKLAKVVVCGLVVSGGMFVGMGQAYADYVQAGDATGSEAVAVGYGSEAKGSHATAVGCWAHAGENAYSAETTAVGYHSLADAYATTAVGVYAHARANGAVALGTGSNGEYAYATAVGNSAQALAPYTVAIGGGSTGTGVPDLRTQATANRAVAVGTGAWAEAQNSVALGYNAKVGTEVTNSVALGADSIATAANTVSVGSEILQRKIVNVAAGEADNDAVIVKQIKVAKGNYIKEGTDVAGNFGLLDDKLKANADDLVALGDQVKANEGNLAKKADKTDLEAEAKAREQGDEDTLNKAKNYTDHKIEAISGGASEALEKLDNRINQTNDRVNRVGAAAAALAAINYQPMSKGQSQIAVGMGGYKGKKATALGVAYQITDRVSGSVAGSANGSEHMFNVGFNYLFGQHSNKDVAQMAAVPGSMTLKEAELQSEVESQNAKISNLEAEIAELKAMVKALAAK